MSTSNFFNKNASKIYTCDDETFDETLSFIRQKLLAKGWQKESQIDNERNYTGKTFASLYLESRRNSKYSCNIQAICRSGYYEGCNFDFEIDFYLDGYDDNEDSMSQSFLKQVYSKIRVLEKIYQEETTPLKVAYRFSNGETEYSFA